MIPPPIDPALLREHAYHDTGILNIVLNPDTYTDEGGYKPVLGYGLGYYNYAFGIGREVDEKSSLEMARFHIYKYFNWYLLLLVLLGLWWYASVASRYGPGGFGVPALWKGKKLKKREDEDGDVEYHHVKV